MVNKKINLADGRILIMGLTFKENCPDLRNTKVVDIIKELQDYNLEVDVYDPWVTSAEAKAEYDLNMVKNLQPGTYDGIVIAVSHHQFKTLNISDIRQLCKDNHVIFDVKNIFPAEQTDGRL